MDGIPFALDIRFLKYFLDLRAYGVVLNKPDTLNPHRALSSVFLLHRYISISSCTITYRGPSWLETITGFHNFAEAPWLSNSFHPEFNREHPKEYRTFSPFFKLPTHPALFLFFAIERLDDVAFK